MSKLAMGIQATGKACRLAKENQKLQIIGGERGYQEAAQEQLASTEKR